jgi:hypothetical protein
MRIFLAFLITKFVWALVIPFIFLFGHFALFQELMVIVADLIDTVGLFYLLFGIIVAIVLYRNFSFQTFFRVTNALNPANLRCGLNIFFNAVKDFFLALGKKLKNFFNKKK